MISKIIKLIIIYFLIINGFNSFIINFNKKKLVYDYPKAQLPHKLNLIIGICIQHSEFRTVF